MSSEEVICANEGCDVRFVKATHNQKYHSDECCRIATNRKIMEKYYARRDQLAGKTRYCQTCRVTKLSRYNDSQICSACELSKQVSANNAVLSMIANVGI